MKETFPLKLKSRQLMALWHVSTHSANLRPDYSFEFHEARQDKGYQWTRQTGVYNTTKTQVTILMKQISHAREN
jgi:hypothetical protein